jgi:hypothetical protein
MKIDRVILVTNNNPLYYDFWNNLSYTYKEKFGITPTLIFFGEEDELKNANLSTEYGEILIEKKISNISEWQYTWALFYFTKFYPSETCIIMGIDQIPLGTYFFKETINLIDENNYIMLIDDQYKFENKYPKKWDEGGFSPSAYHIAKGQTFCDIYKFEESFELEIKKINSLNLKTMWGDKWGTDEAYSCKILSSFEDKSRISSLSLASTFLNRRIDCHRHNEVSYDISKLNSNFFIECHACRPYNHHKTYLDNLFFNIPKFI